MTRASFLLIALSFLVLPSCTSVSLGGSEDDGGTQPGGGKLSGGSGGNGGSGTIDAPAQGGQGGGGTSGTEPCKGMEIPDFDCGYGIPSYVCVARGSDWAWSAVCPERPLDGGLDSAGTCQPRNFDVDCYRAIAIYTCVQRGGKWVWDYTCPDPLTDGGASQPVDAGVAPACDVTKAAQALSAAGLTTVGESKTLNETLPSNLASSSNWGVKEIACREGGYDLATVAGKSVCLVSFATTDICQQVPVNAWAVMAENSVRCIYKAVGPSSPVTPGVYSVHDSSCRTPDAGASCPSTNPAARSCRSATSECVPSSCQCADDGQWRCTADCRLDISLCADAGV